MRFSESAWFNSYDITRKTPGDIRILVRESVPFPFLSKDEHGLVICLPNPKRLEEGSLEYQGMVFDPNNEAHNQIIWGLFKASVDYLSLYACASNVRAYSNCLKGRNEHVALNTMNLVEDAMISAYLKAFHRPFLQEITFADAVSYLLMKPAHLIRNDGVRFTTSVLSFFKTGMIKGELQEGMLRDVKEAVNLLRELEKETIKAHLNSQDRSAETASSPPIEEDHGRTKSFSEIYEGISRYSSLSLSEVPSLLYMNHLTRNSIFYDNVKPPDEDEVNGVLDEMKRALDLKIDLGVKSFKNEAVQAVCDWMAKERKEEKILERYRLLGEGVRFKSFDFPDEDYAEYIRRKDCHSKTIRHITNRLCVYYNLPGDDFRKDSGLLDLQEAIQVVASQSRRTDVFVEDTLRYRAQAWAILVDVSLSLRDFAGEVKDVILCLSEVSRKLFSDNRSLGIFAFGDKFYVIKDFSENHTRSVCARIGGIEHTGMTYLSDGVKMTTNALRARSEETRVLIVVSDGVPTGYRNATEETTEQINRTTAAGVHCIGVGIDSQGISDFFPVHCIVRNPYELMKSFTDTFFQYSSMM